MPVAAQEAINGEAGAAEFGGKAEKSRARRFGEACDYVVKVMNMMVDHWKADDSPSHCIYDFPELTAARSADIGSISRFPEDVQKETEPHVYLSKEEVKEKIQSYNSSVTDKLKMTLNSNGIYTGFIKVQMELCRPITVQSSSGQGTCAPSNNDSAFYLPNDCVNTLHISSTNTVREVIEALLKKFFVADNPAKFALYKRCHKEDQVYICKLSDREHPLYLRLVAGPRTEMLSFVLREHETGEVMWEAFSLPELQNFLRILDKEENEQLQILKKRYAAYRDKLEEALGGVWKPG
ncbi:UNVERIFIED_CONTAM: hypothetical protein H355_012651 [Colinus virginianus]|nr:hypothetical protein H355_012651 [Colinus virginianus]